MCKQDELNSRTIILIIQTERLTGNVLQKAIRESLYVTKKMVMNIHDFTPKGKQSLYKQRAQGVMLSM